MARIAHTPGPWRLFNSQHGGWIIEDVQGRLLCERAPWQRNADESAANASLIAAAPDLLAECREALRWAENRPENWSIQLADRLRAAIAKAESRS